MEAKLTLAQLEFTLLSFSYDHVVITGGDTKRLSLIAAIALAAVGSAAAPARASQDITVQAFFYFGQTPTGSCDQYTDAHCEPEYDYQLVNGVETAEYVLPVPAHFVQAPSDGATIDVERNKITITNDIGATFCSDGTSVGSACTDDFTGFEFIFSIAITPSLVKVDSASASDFLPNDTGGSQSHDGLSQIAPNILVVDLTGDAPAIGDKLVIDIPEPSTWAMMALGFAGLGFAAYRRAGVVRVA